MDDPMLGGAIVAAVGTLGGVAITAFVSIWMSRVSHDRERALASERERESRGARIRADRYGAYFAWTTSVRDFTSGVSGGPSDSGTIIQVYLASDEINLVGTPKVREAVLAELEMIEAFSAQPSVRREMLVEIQELQQVTLDLMRVDVNMGEASSK